MRRVVIGIILVILVVVVLVNWGRDSADQPQNGEQGVAGVTEAVTLAPTVSLPEAEPTELPPTAPVPAATPTPTPPPASPTPEPSPTPIVYVVEEFDTLLGIAIEFDTTVEALLAANGISENDFLQIGQELIISTGAETVVNEGEETADQFEPVAQSDTSPADAETAVNEGEETADQFEPAAQADTSLAEPAAASEDTTADTSTVVLAQSNSPAPAQAEVTDSLGETLTQPVVGSVIEPAATAAPQAAAANSAAPVASEPPAGNVSRPANINPLTGLAVADPAILQRRPLMVRIGNDVGARQSQAGLNSADVVYEEITEWWVTRFTAIYLAETPTTVAPVRSARLINVQLVPQYQGALAHSGGSDPVRWEISQAAIVNLDEFYSPLPYYYRPNHGWQTRLAVDTEAARDFMVAQNTEAPVSLHGFQFSDSLNSGEQAENIFIPYPRATSFTQWRYDPASGKYLRWISDSPLYDANGLGQVAASNVIIYFADHQETDIVEDSNGATAIRIQINGRGPAWFFRDGRLNKGYWQTDGTRTPYFAYADGSPYELKPGNTWIEVVPTYFKIGLNSSAEASASP